MPRRKSKEGIQGNALEEIGLGQDLPSGEFNEQPDSGSRIGGMRGKQEYGIEGDVSSEVGAGFGGVTREQDELAAEVRDSAAGFTEFSEEARGEQIEETEEEEAYRDDTQHYIEGADLATLVRYRLRQNPRLHLSGLHVSVESSGLVSISGHVTSEAEKLRVSEVVSALPGVQVINNQLTVAARNSSSAE